MGGLWEYITMNEITRPWNRMGSLTGGDGFKPGGGGLSQDELNERFKAGPGLDLANRALLRISVSGFPAGK